jgi:hypothetical protein
MMGDTLFMLEVLGFRFEGDPFGILGEEVVLGDPLGLPVVRLLFEVVDATDSASDPLRPLDLFFAISYVEVGYLSKQLTVLLMWGG